MALCTIGFYITTFLILPLLMAPVIPATMKAARQIGRLRRFNARIRLFAEAITFYGGEAREEEIANKLVDKVADAKWALVKALAPLYLTLLLIFFAGTRLTYLWFAMGQLSTGDAQGNGITNIPWNDEAIVGGLEAFAAFSAIFATIPVLFGIVSVLLGFVNRVAQVDEACRHLALYAEVAAQNTCIDEDVKFLHTIIETPDHTRTLVRELDYSLGKGSVVIRGPSGAGKSSIIKVLAGLWPCEGGVQRPDKIGRDGIYFVPQQSYTTIGTLRDQICYPDDEQQYPSEGGKDECMEDILRFCELGYLLDRWGLDTETNWDEQLSGGESQRLGFARVFYHRPKYAIMDESTSALDEHLQEKMLDHMLELKIQMISIAHRPEVFKWHTHFLELDGKGGITKGEVPDSKVQGRSEVVVNA